MNKRLIAINLPQFHPFKENDEWWGKGFTEWTNVTKAKPRYHGHYQPQLPTDTGFYDLRLPEARQMQADMAKKYGIYGFCYYHYWFNGHRLMEKPVDEILANREPNFPFMLCWANENWARNWDGGFKNVLIEQHYSKADDIAHMKYLCEKVFSDKRYITVDGKPVFAIYKPNLFPNIKETISTWREVAKQYGLELYLISAKRTELTSSLINMGFDSCFDFQPLNQQGFSDWYWRNIPFRLYRFIFKNKENIFSHYLSYKSYVDFQTKKYHVEGKCYPCVTPNWDNSPRRVNKPFMAFVGSTPDLFYKWLKYIYNKFIPFSKDENFIFINAWNEWAEGNHLEPDLKWGKKYLEAINKVISI